MKKISISIILLLITTAAVFSASGDISCKIRYYNKKIYYTGDNVTLRVELFNNSAENFTFQVAEPRHYNIKVTLKDLSGRELDDQYKFSREINSVQHVYYRNMTIQPGEFFSFNLRLNDVVDIKEAGLYFVQLDFFPGFGFSKQPVKSNIIDLSIRPDIGVSEIQRVIDDKTGEILRKEKKGPDAVVEYMLNALQKSEYEKYFLYLDLEKLMIKSESKRERYNRLSEAERYSMVNEYKNYLLNLMQTDYRTADSEDIIYVPLTYTINKTWYTQDHGEVLVTEKFKYEDLTEIKNYTYRLTKIDDIWMITDYIVINKGTE